MSIEIRQNVIDVTVNVRQDGLAISLQPVIVRNGGEGGGGDVNGPASATNENIAVFDSTTGKIIKDGGINVSAINLNTAKVGFSQSFLTLQAEWTGNTVLAPIHNTATIFTAGFTTTINPNDETYQDNFEAFLDNTGGETAASIVCTAMAGYTYRVNGATAVASGTFSLAANKLCYIMRKLGSNLIIINGDVE